MSNIVPKNPEDGQLGRLNRRWSALHTKLANVESVKLAGAVANPDANELHIDESGNLKLGNNSVALQGDLDQLSALLNAFLSETGDDGVGEIISSFGTTYDTLRELIYGLETLTSYAQISYVDAEIATLAGTITNLETQLSGTITAIDGRVTTNTNNITSLTSTVAGLSLDSLTDVNVSSGTLTAGQVLKYDGTEWVAGADQDSVLTTSGTLNAIQIKGASGLSDASILLEGSGSIATLVAESGTTLNIGSSVNPVSQASVTTLDADAATIDTLIVSSSLTQTSGGSDLFTRVSNLENAPAPVTSLGNLSDVTLGTLTAATHDGAALVYNASTSEWEAGEVDLADLASTVDSLVAGGGAPSSGSADLLQVSNGSGAFAERGVSLEQTQTGSTFSTVFYSKSSANRVSLGQGTTGSQLEDVSTDQITFATGDSSTPAATLTATASTLNFKGAPLASVSYVNNVAGSGVSVTGSAQQFEVSDGNGDLTPIGLSASTSGATLTGLIPSLNEQTDLGSATNKFRHLYLSGNSLFLGDATISSTASTLSLGGSAIAFANQLNAYALSSTVTALDQEVTTLTSAVSASLSDVDARITSLSGTLSSVESGLSTAEGNIATVQSDLSTAQGNITTLQGDATSLASSITSINGQVSTINSSITTLQNTDTSIQASVASNTSSITTNTSSITTLNTDLGTAQNDISALQTTASSITSLNTALQSELNTTQTGAGLNADGTYTPNTSATFISTATSLKNADSLLNDRLVIIASDLDSLQTSVNELSTGNADDLSTLQAEIDNTQAGAGLGGSGSYSANSSANYISSATTLRSADDLLDAQIKTNADAISSNASDITTNASSISTNSASISSNSGLISTNTSDISTNASSISTNTSSITSNAASISTNTANISTNTSNISTQSASINTNATDIASNTTSISTNATNISTNTSNISTNASSISTNTSNITANASGITTNASSITSITARVTSLEALDTLEDLSVSSPVVLTGNTLSLDSGGVRALFSATGDASYNSGTGQFSVTTYKTANFETDLGNSDTDALSEGSTNLYYTDARVATYLSTNSYADQSYVNTQVSNLVDSAPAALDTLNELAAALGDDPNFATTVTNSLAGKQASLSVEDNGTLGSSLALTSSGTLTYTGPSSSNIVGVFSAGSNVSITTSGTISTTGTLSAQVDNIDNFTTDDLSEGSNRLYYTEARVRNAVSVTDNGGDGALSYDSSTGAISYTGPSAAEARAHFSASGDLVYNGTLGQFSVSTYSGFDTDFSAKSTSDLSEGTNLYYTDARARGSVSVTDAGGDGSLSYDSSTGVITYTGVSAAETRAHLSGANDVTYSASTGVISVVTYKTADFETDLGASDTDDLSEGSNNLYYTDARSRSAVSASGDLSYDSSTGVLSVTTYKTSNFNADLASSDTDDLSEGSSNLYYTDARSRAAVSASGDLSYDSSTGVFSFTERTDDEVRQLISVTDSGGDGSLSYNSSSGALTYTGPSASDVRAHFSAGSNISISSGEIALASNISVSDLDVSGEFVVQGHIVESFDHGSITGAHSSQLDFGSVTSDLIYHSSDLGGLDNGSFI